MKQEQRSVLSVMGQQPEKINGNFLCGNNQLTSLVGCPATVGGYFACDKNQLTSLNGCPIRVGCYFYCTNNKLASLHDIHKHVKKMRGEFWCKGNPIKSHVLGLFLIEGITGIVMPEQWAEIADKHIKHGKRGMLACQRDLIDAGLEELAQL